MTLSATDFSFDNSGTIAAITPTLSGGSSVIVIGGGDGSAANSVVVTNRGAIDVGLMVGATARTVAVANSGTIGGTGVSLSQGSTFVAGPVAGTGTFVDQASTTFTNSGAITGGAAVLSAATTTTATNSGTITGSAGGGEAFYVAAPTQASSTIAVVNRGTATTAAPGGVGLGVIGYASTGTAAAGVPPLAGGSASTVGVANSGTLRADGGGLLLPGDGTPDDPDLLVAAAGLSATAFGDGGSSVTVTNAVGGIVAAAGKTTTVVGGETPTMAVTGGGSVALFAAATRVAITNAGTITGGPGMAAAATVFVDRTTFAAPDAYLAGAIQTFGSVDTLVNASGGVITGSVDLGAFDDRIENYGTIAGNVFLRDGNDTFVESLGGRLTGTVDGGPGVNTLILDTSAGGALTQALLDRFVDFAAPVVTGNGTITAAGSLNLPTLTFTGSALTLAAGTTLATTGPVTITTGEADVAITNLGTVAGGIAFGNGRDTLTNVGAIGGSVTLGNGVDRATNGGTIGGGIAAGDGAVVLVNAGTVGAVRLGNGNDTVTNSGRIASLALGTGPDAVTNTGTITGALGFGGNGTLTNGGIIGGPVAFVGSGTVSNSGTIAGPVSFAGSGAIVGNGGTITGAVGFGSSGTLTNDGIIGASVTLGAGAVTNRGTIGGIAAGDGAVVLANAGTVGAVILGNGVDTVTNSGRITSLAVGTGPDAVTNTGTITGPVAFTGSGTLTNGGTIAGPVSFVGSGASVVNTGTIGGGITFAGGSNTLTVAGPVTGAVGFGSGNDTLIVEHGARFGGPVDGGAGSNTLVIAAGGSDAAPDELDLTRVAHFDQTRQDGGVAALSGSFATGTLTIAAGRLIGRTGSTISASTISVAPGATFGSAGTVNGAIAVGGILSPGASPGTMTVGGSVALAAGSTSLFEFTPAVSDQLLVSGAVTIAGGATLTLTGTRPLTAGALDLIVASGGISGSFTVSQSPTVRGYLLQSANRLQLFGLFAIDPALPPQVTRTVTYVNGILTGGAPSGALLAALPSLLTGGTSNAAAFAQLSPEAYASASRIGTENGLTLAAALRTAGDDAPRRDGPFTFVTALGGWRQLRGDAAAGVARADVDGGGVIGGIGIARGAATIGWFGGYLDSHQTLAGRGTHTRADGAIAGLSVTLGQGPLTAAATLAYDGSSARTTRTVPGGTTRGDYALHGFVADATLRYAVPAGGLVLRPEVGLTHVATMRAAVTETGSAAFALAVAPVTDTADFVDGALRLGLARPAAFAPWVAVGVRHQFDGVDRFATAAFVGQGSGFTVPGVGAAATVGSASAGFVWRLGVPLALYGSYRGEFAGGETGHTASLGARFTF